MRKLARLYQRFVNWVMFNVVDAILVTLLIGSIGALLLMIVFWYAMTMAQIQINTKMEEFSCRSYDPCEFYFMKRPGVGRHESYKI